MESLQAEEIKFSTTSAYSDIHQTLPSILFTEKRRRQKARNRRNTRKKIIHIRVNERQSPKCKYTRSTNYFGHRKPRNHERTLRINIHCPIKKGNGNGYLVHTSKTIRYRNLLLIVTISATLMFKRWSQDVMQA